MNQDPNIQGNPFVQQKQINSKPIQSSLANPTPFHLAAISQRANNGAPPTPNNSFQNNPLSDGTLDPQLLPFQQQHQFLGIKQELAHQDFDDLDTTNPMSPSSTTACNSPHEPGFGSPSANSFEDFGRSYKPTSHIDSIMMGGGSANPLPTNSFSANSFPANSFPANSMPANSFPANQIPANSLPANTFYDNIPTDNYSNDEYIFSTGEIAMSAPVTSPIGVDVKANNQKINYNSRHLHNNLNNFAPHSVPTIPNVSDWQQYGASLDSTSLQFSNSGEMQGFESIENEKDAMASEKRRRRRESHNAVERRRRDNINEKIQELSTLLPDLYVDSSNKPNKGVILRKSVDYIRHLQLLFERERDRSSKLESQVRELASKTGNNPGSSSNGSDLNNSSDNGNLYGSSMP